mgnify:CR=1 FL=1
MKEYCILGKLESKYLAPYDNTDITRVNIPDSVKEIGKAAFSGCTNARITYPRNATVYSDAFEGCRSAIKR